MVSRILAFDTSTDVTAVAVTQDDQVLAELDAPSSERHAQLLLPRVNECLAHAGLTLADIELFAVGVGPGSFTGVRVGLATAKGFALATGKPVRGVISLEALAHAAFAHQGVPKDALCAPVLDAHKGEVFAGSYQRNADGELVSVLAPFHALPLMAAEQLAVAAADRVQYVLGQGVRRYPDMLLGLLAERVLPSSFDFPKASVLARQARRALARVGESDLRTLVPEYLRGSDAQLPKAPLRLT